MLDPIVVNLVLRKQGMEQAQWKSLLLTAVVILSTILTVVMISWGDAGAIYTNSLPEMRPNVPKEALGQNRFSGSGYIKTSHGIAKLWPNSKITVVREDPRSTLSLRAIPISPVDHYANSLDSGDGPPSFSSFDTNVVDGDYYGLPEISRKAWICPTGQLNHNSKGFNTLPVGHWPKVSFSQSSYSPNLQLIPESTYVAGTIFIPTNGWMRFSASDERMEGMSDALYSYLVDALIRAFARTPCVPAIRDGLAIETQFPVRYYFNVENAQNRDNRADVIMLTY